MTIPLWSADAPLLDPVISTNRPAPAWGAIQASTNGAGLAVLEVRDWPTSGKLLLPTPFPHVTAARQGEGATRRDLVWSFNADATRLELEIGPKPATGSARIELETAEKTTAFADGRVTFSALDAVVTGKQAKLETHPGNHRIGFWLDPNDTVSWNFKPTRWGRYDLWLAYSADGGPGTEAVITVGNQTFTIQREPTGSWYRYRTVHVANFYLEKAEPIQVSVRGGKKTGVAVMNLKALTLSPAPEGSPIVQSASGQVTLHARDALVRGVTLRYEPQPNKNCLGYWVNPRDYAEWSFELKKPGAFEVEVWQGCGTGHGGSDVAVEIDGKRMEFTVIDTGHFQNFVPRRLGRVEFAQAGRHQVAIKPIRKKGGAVMDIREIRLVPAAAQ